MINTCSLRQEYRDKRKLLGLNPPMPKELRLEDSEIETFKGIVRFILIAGVILIAGCMTPKHAAAQEYTNEEIVNAIYKAEGGKHAKKPYGILSLSCTGEKDCRRVCLNTVRNNRIRYKRDDRRFTEDYLSYLSRKYAPTRGRITKTEAKLNVNWLGNVRYFLERDT